MSAENAGTLFVFGFGLLVTVIRGIIDAATPARAESSAAHAAVYREPAEKADRDAAEVKASLSETKGRVAAIERMLEAVERPVPARTAENCEQFLRIGRFGHRIRHARTHERD